MFRFAIQELELTFVWGNFFCAVFACSKLVSVRPICFIILKSYEM